MNRFTLSHATIAVCFLFPQIGSAQYVWDANGNGSGVGGTGTWNTSDLRFRYGSDTGPLINYINGFDNDVTLGGLSGSVNLSGTIQVRSLTVQPIIDNVYSLGGT